MQQGKYVGFQKTCAALKGYTPIRARLLSDVLSLCTPCWNSCSKLSSKPLSYRQGLMGRAEEWRSDMDTTALEELNCTNKTAQIRL